MSGYETMRDILPCPVADAHEWVPMMLAPQPDGIIMKCAHCRGFVAQRWWGYEFQTEEFSAEYAY